MTIIRLLDARRGLYRKCEELFGDAKIAEAIYRFLCDGIDDCEDVAHERKKGKWIPVDEKKAEIPCLACDNFGQIFIPYEIVSIDDKNYDGENFDFDIDKFLNGKKIANGIRVLPREIKAWMPLPEPYRKDVENNE